MGRRAAFAVLTCAAVLSGCTATVDGPAARPAPEAPPTPARALGALLPGQEELASALGVAPSGLMGQTVEGGADALLRGVDRTDASPPDCVSATYRLQEMVYGPSPVRSVATRSWAGGSLGGPTMSAYFGVVQFASADDAQAFFAASAQKWRQCDGETMVLQQPGQGGDEQSLITDVAVDERVVSAVVLHDRDGGPGSAGSLTLQRALGVAADCIVDVEISDLEDARADGADGAVHVADLMLDKIAR